MLLRTPHPSGHNNTSPIVTQELLPQKHKNPNNNIVDFIYTYGVNGNILSQQFAHRTETPDNIYTYDNLDRLIRIAYHNNS